jgi:hypothetical protein
MVFGSFAIAARPLLPSLSSCGIVTVFSAIFFLS